MELGLNLKDVLSALERRGEKARADALKRRVMERFVWLSEQETLSLSVDEVVGALELFSQIIESLNLKNCGGLERYLADLKSSGWYVTVGARQSLE